MKTLKTVETLTTRLLEIQRINSAASLLSWDQETNMPAGGGEARAEQQDDADADSDADSDADDVDEELARNAVDVPEIVDDADIGERRGMGARQEQRDDCGENSFHGSDCGA